MVGGPHVTVASFAIVSFSPAQALAYDCTYGGEAVATYRELRWLGSWDSYGRSFVELQGRTSRSVEDKERCGGWVRVEGWIDGGDGARAVQSSYWAEFGNPHSSESVSDKVTKMVYCSDGSQRHTGNTKHWYIENGWFSDPWHDLGTHTPAVDVPGCPES